VIGETAAAFDPLTEGEIASAVSKESQADWQPTMPVPEDAPHHFPLNCSVAQRSERACCLRVDGGAHER